MAPPRRPGRPRVTPGGPISTQAPSAAPAVELPAAPPMRAAEEIELDNRTQSAAEEFVTAIEAPQPDVKDPQEIANELARTRREVERQKTILIGRELEVRQARAVEVEEARRAHRPLPPVRSVLRSVDVDTSLPVDRDGTPVVPPGKHSRWVSMQDASGNQSAQRARQLAQLGYQVARSKVDGKPITNFNHILMICDPEVEAHRVAVAQADLVAQDEAQKAMLRELQQKANRALRDSGVVRGGDAVTMFTPETGEWANEKHSYEVPVSEEMELRGLGI